MALAFAASGARRRSRDERPGDSFCVCRFVKVAMARWATRGGEKAYDVNGRREGTTAGGRQTTGRRSVRTGRYGPIVAKVVYEFDARLVGWSGVRRTIGVRSDQTFVYLHRALQLAFGWDDDHLYTFWLGTKFWPRAGTEFCDPFSFENPSPLGAFFAGERPRKRSAVTRIDRARLLRGE